MNLFLLGAAKCGTTSLHSFLHSMPEVCMSLPKEPFYFECEFDKGPDFYREKYFKHYKNEEYIGEARHRNLYLPYVPERIHNYNPEAKLIVIFRNPVERAYSHWWHAYSRKYEKLSFKAAIAADLERIERGEKIDSENAIEAYCSIEDNVTYHRTYVDSGFYMDQIERYLKLFSKEQLLVLFTEDLEMEPEAVIKNLREFLSLPPLVSANNEISRKNSYKKPEAGEKAHQLARKFGLHILPAGMRRMIYNSYNKFFLRRSDMDQKTRKMLNELYKSHNLRLAQFSGRDLSHWNT